MVELKHLPVIPLRITSGYGKRNTGIKGASTFHKGVDLGRNFNKAETNIYSVDDGRVIKNYWNDYRGWVVVIQHDGYRSLYQHLKDRSKFNVGAEVKAGEIIGIMGNSSNKAKLNVAVHLHFELHLNDKPVDPMPYIEKIRNMEEKIMGKKSHWAEPSLNSLVKKGIIKNPEVHKNLDEHVTKGLLFALLDRITDKTDKNK